jgi:Putative zinc-finger
VDLLLDAAGAEALGCKQFRERHGGYLDGLLPAAELAQVQNHLDECVACARYDRVLRRGLQLARELPEPRPGEDFELRLQHRIFHLQAGGALGQQRPVAGVGVAAALAGLIALIAWSPFLVLDRSSAARAADVGAQAGTLIVPVPSADPLGALVVSWYPGHVPTLPTHPRAVHPTVFPGPYSPLIVNPPVHGGRARTIATEYHTFE